MKKYTAAELIQFEEEIVELFNNAQIKAPIHLYYGNEEEMIRIFHKIHPEDWVFCSWRSHYQCLLKGVPPEQLKQEILSGHSISLCFPEQRVYSSAIVEEICQSQSGLRWLCNDRSWKQRSIASLER